MPMEAIPTLVGLQEPPEIIFYTQTELIKIYLSGAIIAIAVLILTYYLYKYYRAQYERWLLAKEMEGFEGGILDSSHPVDLGINRKLFFVVGATVVLVGLIQILL